MRVLYVIDSLAPGGAESSLAEMAPGLVALGIDLHVLPLGSRMDLEPALREAGVVVHHRTRSPGRTANTREVLEVSRAIHPDLVHTTLFEADIAGRSAASILAIPSSTSIVNDSYGASHYAESKALKLHAARALDALTARYAVRFHAISKAIALSVPPRLGIPMEKVVVIPRGRSPERFPYHTTATRAKARATLGIAGDAPVILTLGRLEPQKGIHHLMRALPLVSKQHPGLVTIIAGKDGRSGPALRSQSEQLGSDVRFLGHRTDIPALLSAADIFCFPSEREGFGGVLIEAMAVGCPIVASSIPTSEEVLHHEGEYCGVITHTGDAEDLAHGINAILDNPNLGRSLSERAHSAFLKNFTIDRVTQMMANFLEGPVELSDKQSR